jgi:predicted amidohydrolase
VPFDTEACIEKAVRHIGEAAATGAKLIVFPEAFISGYPKGLNYGLVVGARDGAGREEFRLYLDAAIDVPGPQTERLGKAAAAHGSFVVMGVIERELARKKDFPETVRVSLGDSPEAVLMRGGSAIISPLGKVLAGPDFEGETIISVALDLNDLGRSKFDFDVVGHYSRPDVFRLIVNEAPMRPVATSEGD